MSTINYFACASWEDRYIESLKFDFDKYAFSKIYLFFFEDEYFMSLSQKNIEVTENFVQENSIQLEKIRLRFFDQLEIYTDLEKIFDTVEANDEYLLNISTMPRHLLYMNLNKMYQYKLNFNTLYYTPKSYGNEIAMNPHKPQLLLKHSGIFEADKETLLIISAGLDIERIFQLYYYFEPHKTIILEETKQFSSISEEQRLVLKDGLDEEIRPDIKMVNAFEENNIYNLLCKELSKDIKDYNTLLCSIGPKIASLELFKYNLHHPDCGLVYALSKEYSVDYSKGLDTEKSFIRNSTFFLK